MKRKTPLRFIAARSLLPLTVLPLTVLPPGCASREQAPRELRLPATPVLSILGQWGVVETNYLRLRTTPSKSAEVLAGLTKGTVVKVLSSTDQKETVENETDYWYRVSLEGLDGWVFGAYLLLVDSESQAAEAAEELK